MNIRDPESQTGPEKKARLSNGYGAKDIGLGFCSIRNRSKSTPFYLRKTSWLWTPGFCFLSGHSTGDHLLGALTPAQVCIHEKSSFYAIWAIIYEAYYVQAQRNYFKYSVPCLLWPCSSSPSYEPSPVPGSHLRGCSIPERLPDAPDSLPKALGLWWKSPARQIQWGLSSEIHPAVCSCQTRKGMWEPHRMCW